MSVLRTLEAKLAGLVEGTFSRAFKSEVRPVEIARKLAREMDEHRVQSLSRTYVPNEYAVWLSPDGPRAVRGLRGRAQRELSGYLLEHARRERIALPRRPQIEFRTDERLRLGEFGIQARLVRPPERAEEAPSQGEHGHTMVYSVVRPAAPSRCASPTRAAAARALLVDGRTELLGSGGAVLGRSRECDIVLDDANVSRHHAEVRALGRLVDRARPRLDERRQGQRAPDRRPAVAQARRRDRARHRPRHASSWSSRVASTPSPSR